jgi:hypothetical protein
VGMGDHDPNVVLWPSRYIGAFVHSGGARPPARQGTP